jgi:plastocyanin
MRRALIAAAAGAGTLVLAAPTASHPGHGFLSVSIKNLSYTPAEVQALQGDTVVWFWDGNDRNHSVTADPGQNEAFDSDPNGPPDQNTHKPSEGFQHTFTQAGTFTYHCKVHAGMKGRVVVAPQDGTPAPPDTTAPALSAVTAKPRTFCTKRSRRCKKRGTVLQFTLGEAADVLVEIRRRKGKRAVGGVVDALDPRGKVGLNRVRLSGPGLKPGGYRITVTATDAQGNTSRARRLNVTVRR